MSGSGSSTRGLIFPDAPVRATALVFFGALVGATSATAAFVFLGLIVAH
jgi:hypothetical protein